MNKEFDNYEICLLLKNRNTRKNELREKFYSRNENLDNINLLSRYGKNSSSISDLNGMTSLEKRMHELLRNLIADDKTLTVAIVDKKSLNENIIINKKDIRVYKEHIPVLYDSYRIKHRPLAEVSTQTYDYGTKLKPLWKTHTSFRRPENKSKEAFGLKSYNETYSAYDLRFSRYLRIKQENNSSC